MACYQEANKGGYSIITQTKKVYNFLKKERPNYLKILKGKFLIERRGFNYPNKNMVDIAIHFKKQN